MKGAYSFLPHSLSLSPSLFSISFHPFLRLLLFSSLSIPPNRSPFINNSVTSLAPSSGPETIDILGTTTNSIRLYWTKVPEKSRNGIITTYSLCYQEYELEHSCSSFQNIPSGSRNFILSDLQPFKEYLILIRAATVVGWGLPTSICHWTLSAREYYKWIFFWNNGWVKLSFLLWVLGSLDLVEPCIHYK